MDNVKLSELPAADPLDGQELLPVLQAGTGRKATAAQLQDFVAPAAQPVADGWTNPSGSGFIRGSFNSDDETEISSTPTQSEVTELSNRLKDTRAVLRALVLDLKTIGILGD